MYCGFDKDGGSTIGDLSRAVDYVNFEDIQDSSAAEEILVCQDDEGQECILVSFIHPSTGELGWKRIRDIDEDKSNSKVVKMSQMTSMLRDCDRNSSFEGAISKIIQNFIERIGRPPIVLDIGTGTGLLSLLCMRHGAQYIFTAEMFAPLATIAQEVVFSNKESDNIMIISGKSTDIDDDSLPIRPDLIVSELLDSALIGESVITSHADAINRLLSRDIDAVMLPMKDRILPNSGLVFATLVESKEVAQLRRVPVWHSSLSPWRTGQSKKCDCMQPLIPVQWDQFERRNSSTKALSSSRSILNIEFFNENLTDSFASEFVEERFGFSEGTFETDITVTADGTIHGIYLWWETMLLSEDLDGEREFTYSTEPRAQNWQDHWQQTVYPLPSPITCRTGDVILVSAAHNCSRIWLSARLKPRKLLKSVRDESTNNSNKKTKVVGDTANQPCAGDDDDCDFSHETLRHRAPVAFENRLQHEECTCGWHILCNPDRLLMLNDPRRINLWTVALSRLLDELAPLEKTTADELDALNVILDISDGSMLSLLAATKVKERLHEFPRLKVVSKERKQFSRMFHGQLAESNDLEDSLMLWNGESVDDIAEFFAASDDDMGDDDMEAATSTDEDCQPQKQSPNCTVVALIGECFYYQLRSRPTWQALSFHYQRSAMQSIMHEKAIVMPCRALIKAAAFEIPQLRNSFGEVGRVSGFDHSAYDAAVSGWHENTFHFKLSSYSKTLLTSPEVLTSLDYSEAVLPCRSSSTMTITVSGQCHCVAIWVDYQLFEDSEDLQMRTWVDNDFVPYEKVSVQFFPMAVAVEPGKHCIRYSCEFDVGESDFRFHFEVET